MPVLLDRHDRVACGMTDKSAHASKLRKAWRDAHGPKVRDAISVRKGASEAVNLRFAR